MTPSVRKSIPDPVTNRLFALCGDHHRIVDNNPRIFSVEVLAKYKADHEAKVAPKDLRPKPPTLETDTVDLSLLPVAELPAVVWRPSRRSGRAQKSPSTCHARKASRFSRSCC